MLREPVRPPVTVQVPPEGGAPPLRGDGDPDVGEHGGAPELDVGEVAHEGGEPVAPRDEVHLLVHVQVSGGRVQHGVRVGIVHTTNAIVGNLVNSSVKIKDVIVIRFC